MSFAEHRRRMFELMEDNSVLIVYAGMDPHANEDDYYKLIVNSNFYWLTGLERAGMVLMMTKVKGKTASTLFIEEEDPFTVRWTGKMPSREDAAASSELSLEEIQYTGNMDRVLNRLMTRTDIRNAYFDVWKCNHHDIPHWNGMKGRAFAEEYPAVRLHDLHILASRLRIVKDAEEIEMVRKAVDTTRRGLEFVLENLKPGKTEYQVEADFWYKCRYLGMNRLAFETISASGPNACMMHYRDNDRVLQENDLILLDLGAKYGNYCSDITRTYPAGGKYTPRQRQIYDLVLKANKAVKEAARPGVTTLQLQEVASRVLGEGLTELGLIQDPSQVGKYYMHSCSHPIGVDVHDIESGKDVPMEAGWIISDEPGLYIDEEGIGIRIEDDLLITENGAEYLSADIMREPEEIERYMAEHGK